MDILPYPQMPVEPTPIDIDNDGFLDLIGNVAGLLSVYPNQEILFPIPATVPFYFFNGQIVQGFFVAVHVWEELFWRWWYDYPPYTKWFYSYTPFSGQLVNQYIQVPSPDESLWDINTNYDQWYGVHIHWNYPVKVFPNDYQLLFSQSGHDPIHPSGHTFANPCSETPFVVSCPGFPSEYYISFTRRHAYGLIRWATWKGPVKKTTIGNLTNLIAIGLLSLPIYSAGWTPRKNV